MHDHTPSRSEIKQDEVIHRKQDESLTHPHIHMYTNV